ncbi:MAG: hypothetical protein COB09_15715 [Thalassobium sp.]|nr:MAG: hypothetical protein COB09_15715 [Thalassobium sp.]
MDNFVGNKIEQPQADPKAKGRMPEVSPIIRVTEIAGLFRADLVLHSAKRADCVLLHNLHFRHPWRSGVSARPA